MASLRATHARRSRRRVRANFEREPAEVWKHFSGYRVVSTRVFPCLLISSLGDGFKRLCCRSCLKDHYKLASCSFPERLWAVNSAALETTGVSRIVNRHRNGNRSVACVSWSWNQESIEES